MPKEGKDMQDCHLKTRIAHKIIPISERPYQTNLKKLIQALIIEQKVQNKKNIIIMVPK